MAKKYAKPSSTAIWPNAPVELGAEVGALLRHLGAKRGREPSDSILQAILKSNFEHRQILLRSERIRGSGNFDLDGSHDRTSLRRCDIGLRQNLSDSACIGVRS